MIKLKSYSARTHQGPHLQINEDDVDIDLSNKLYLMFDGFGGASVGDEVVKLAKEKIKRFYTRITDDPNSTLPFFFSPRYLVEGNALVNAMYIAHNEILKRNEDKEMQDKGGTSMIGVAQAENICTFASVGNCSAYLLRNGKLKPIIEPDNALFLSKDLKEKYLYSYPNSGLGLFEDVQIEVKEVRVTEGDTILLLTDGVYSRLDEEEIRFILSNGDWNMPRKATQLFDLANRRGNLDNQSTIFLHY